MSEHIPVLLEPVVRLLPWQSEMIVVDATVGLGGHSQAIMRMAVEKQVKLRLIGLDQDESALAKARERLGEQVTLIQANFGDLAMVLADLKIASVQAVLMDIGVSSLQLDTAERGFSFQENGPLDMRMNRQNQLTAAEVVNRWPQPKLADLFFQYGEERLGRKIARAICEARQKQPFTETKQLADLIVAEYPPPARYKRPHPATRVFQALRIAVNQELVRLEQGIAAALTALAPGGVLIIISFHSSEDRIVKHRFREALAAGQFQLLTKKPIVPTAEEEEINPRSRSAKLRAIQKLPLPG